MLQPPLLGVNLKTVPALYCRGIGRAVQVSCGIHGESARGPRPAHTSETKQGAQTPSLRGHQLIGSAATIYPAHRRAHIQVSRGIPDQASRTAPIRSRALEGVENVACPTPPEGDNS